MYIGYIVSYILIFNYYIILLVFLGFKYGCKDLWLLVVYGSYSLVVIQYVFGFNEMCCGLGDGVKRCGVVQFIN